MYDIRSLLQLKISSAAESILSEHQKYGHSRVIICKIDLLIFSNYGIFALEYIVTIQFASVC